MGPSAAATVIVIGTGTHGPNDARWTQLAIHSGWAAECAVQCVRMQLVGKRIKRNMRKRVGLGWWTRLFTRSVTVTKCDPLLINRLVRRPGVPYPHQNEWTRK